MINIDPEFLVQAVKELCRQSHETAQQSGWWDKHREPPELLCLVHSEISEALEAYRTYEFDDETDPTIGKPEGFTVELADTLIRIFDLAEAYELPLGEMLLAKMAYNRTRSYRHGGKLA